MAFSHTLSERPLQQLCTTVKLLLDKIYFISVVLVTSYPGYIAGNWQQIKMPFQVPTAFHLVRSETDSTFVSNRMPKQNDANIMEESP